VRSNLRVAFSLVAASAVILALSGASLPLAPAAESPQASVKPLDVFAPYRVEAPVLSDPQRIAAAAPERAALAVKASESATAVRARVVSAERRTKFVVASSHSVYVWTSGFQAQVNACRGGVDLTAAYHTRTVGEHWSCGGASFPEAAGTIVTFTGLDAGNYRVIGVVATLNAYVAHTSNIPHGYDMLFQTCRGGNSHYTIFIALARM
jgi:hypothetical protein